MVSFIQIDGASDDELLDQLQQLQQSSFFPCWSNQQVTKHLRHTRSISFALVDDTQRAHSGAVLIGYVFYQLMFESADLLQIAIHPDYRRAGHAANLIAKSFTQLAEQKLEVIQLEVRESNQYAIELYRRLGFAFDGTRKHYYPPLDHQTQRESALLYSKRLQAAVND